MHAGFCVLSFLLVYFAYPETMGVPLEEMGRSLSLLSLFLASKFRVEPSLTWIILYLSLFPISPSPFLALTILLLLSALTSPSVDELFGDQPTRPLLGSGNSFSNNNPIDGAPLRRSHSFPGFRRGLPHEHSDASEPPKIVSRPRRHQRTLSGSASLPGKGGPGVNGVRDWWSGSGIGSQPGSRPTSRPGTPGIGEEVNNTKGITKRLDKMIQRRRKMKNLLSRRDDSPLTPLSLSLCVSVCLSLATIPVNT